MSYDIYIGDARRTSNDEDSEDYYFGLEWYVPHMVLDDAPQFDGDEMTGQGNSRHPAYATWHAFVEQVGLNDLFFNTTTGLMWQHPGCAFLTTEHYQAVKSARVAYEIRHPHQVPGWREGQDATLARLLWLEWWMMTTLKTAEVPAIFNH